MKPWSATRSGAWRDACEDSVGVGPGLEPAERVAVAVVTSSGLRRRSLGYERKKSLRDVEGAVALTTPPPCAAVTTTSFQPIRPE